MSNTKDIGAFTIISQESVASGIRRISAYTGPKVIEEVQQLRVQIENFGEILHCQPKQIAEKIQKLLKEYKQLQENYESIQTHIITQQLQKIKNNNIFYDSSKKILFLDISNTRLMEFSFKTCLLQAKQLRPHQNRLLCNQEGNFALYI